MTRSSISRRAFVVAAPALWAGSARAEDDPGILFVGNSLTYRNNLPLIVQALFDASGGPSYRVSDVSGPDFGLQDHWRHNSSRSDFRVRRARREIARGGWDYVVLQQGPSSLPESRQNLRDYTRRFADLIVASGARPALYSVWPQRRHAQTFPRAIESYELAAADVGALLFPVARAWLAALLRDPALELYEADGLHPTLAGSCLAAMVMHAVLTGRSPVGTPTSWRLRDGRQIELPPDLAVLLQAAAAEATSVA